MYSGKKLLAAVMASTMLLSLAACGNKGTASGSASSAAAASGSAAASTGAELSEWEKASNILAADETEADLYEKAKAEGQVTLYSISSRCEAVAQAFMEAYPGVTCTPYDIATNELLEKVTREYEAGVHTCDVVHIKDQDGSIYNEYVLPKKFYNYQPADLMAHVAPGLTQYSTPMYLELCQWFYNTEDYPNGAPIDSWWDLTRPEWKGKIMMTNPNDNITYMALFTGLVLDDQAALLEKDYEEQFGEKLVLSEGCANAGYELVKRLYDNEPMFATGSDEIAEAVGARGQKNAPIGLLSSVKARNIAKNDWAMATINIKPNTGIPAVNSLYVVEGAEHPNAAKLLIRFMIGGTDGTSKGYEPFNTLGGWPVRDDIQPAEGSTPYASLNVQTFDPLRIYETSIDFQDFWLKVAK